jgi:hypothetical protein
MNRLAGHSAIWFVGIAILLSPAFALDVSVSGGTSVDVSGGGASVGAGGGVSVGVSSGGASVGAGGSASIGVSGGGASVGGGGSASVGVSGGAASVGGGGSASAGVGGGGLKAGAGVAAGGASAGAGVSTEAAATTGGSGAAAAGNPRPRASSAAASRLPKSLVPRRICPPTGGKGCTTRLPSDQDIGEISPRFTQAVVALAMQPSAPRAIVNVCRNGIIQAALPFAPVRVDVVSAGKARKGEGGGQVARLVVRIVYDRDGGYETREAEVTCHVDADGTVVSLA